MQEGETVQDAAPRLRDIHFDDYHEVNHTTKEITLSSEDLENYDGFNVLIGDNVQSNEYVFTKIDSLTSDVLYLNYGYGPIDSGVGDDKIEFKVDPTFSTKHKEENIIVAGPGNDQVTNLSKNQHFFTSHHTGLANIYGGSGDDTISGSDINDTIHGDEHDSIIGNYVYFELAPLQGHEGNDKLFGGKGSDTLYGNGGNDLLDGGPRGEGFLDISTGGKGADGFLLSYNSSDQGSGPDFFSAYIEKLSGPLAKDLVKQGVQEAFKTGAEDLIKTLGGAMVMTGVGDAGGILAQSLVNFLINLAAAKPPTKDEDVLVITDFNPSEDVIFLPVEQDKNVTLDETVAYFTSTGGGQEGWGIKFTHGTSDTVFAEVMLDENYLKALNLESKDANTATVINQLLSASAKFTPDQLQNNSPLAATLPDGALKGAADSGVEITVFGAFGPITMVDAPRVGGTQFSDVLTVNEAIINPTKIRGDLDAVTSDGFLRGFAGGDLLLGGLGRDVIYGDEGDDDIYGFTTESITEGGASIPGDSAQEFFYGGAGNDVIYTGVSLATIDGGTGTDTLSFAVSDAASDEDKAVTVTMAAGNAFDSLGSAAAANYTFTNIENVTGSVADDTITGDGQDNIIEGGPGADTMDGAGGTDTLSYQGSSAPVTADLVAGTGEGGDAKGDTFVNFEGLLGSAHDDTLIAANAPKRSFSLDGNDGDDMIVTGNTHAAIHGGKGIDTLDFKPASSAIWLDGKAGIAFDSLGTRQDPNYTVIAIEQVVGSSYGDFISMGVATKAESSLEIHGEVGNDILQFSSGYKLLGGPGADVFTPLARNFFHPASSTIQDFNQSDGDKVDLRALGAKSTDQLDIEPYDPNNPNTLAVTATAGGIATTFLVQNNGAALTLTKADFIFTDTLLEGTFTAQRAAPEITFELADSAFENALGVFTVGEDGLVEDVDIVIGNARHTDAGTVFDLDIVEENDTFAFFLVQDTDLRDLEGDLALHHKKTGDPLRLADDGDAQLVHADFAGQTQVIDAPVFTSIDRLDGFAQARSAVHDDGRIELGFEDLDRRVASDNDFNDLEIIIG